MVGRRIPMPALRLPLRRPVRVQPWCSPVRGVVWVGGGRGRGVGAQPWHGAGDEVLVTRGRGTGGGAAGAWQGCMRGGKGGRSWTDEQVRAGAAVPAPLALRLHDKFSCRAAARGQPPAVQAHVPTYGSGAAAHQTAAVCDGRHRAAGVAELEARVLCPLLCRCSWAALRGATG